MHRRTRQRDYPPRVTDQRMVMPQTNTTTL